MSEKEKVDATPQHGPPMSPAIFRDKWAAKFHYLFEYKYRDTDKAETVWMCNLCEAGYWHLFHFYHQATELSLDVSDFPKPDPRLKLEKSEEELDSTEKDLVQTLCYTNPFVYAGTFIRVVDSFLWRLESMKHGQLASGVAWQQLPLKNRQEVNEILLKVEDAKKAGWWVIEEEEQKAIRSRLRQGEVKNRGKLEPERHQRPRGVVVEVNRSHRIPKDQAEK